MKVDVLQKIINTIMNARPEEQGAIGQIAQAAYSKLYYGGKKSFLEKNNLKEEV